MQFSAKTDIEAPIEFVFAQITDFETFERSVMRRGGEVERLHGGAEPAVGTKWQVKFQLRGKQRTVVATVETLDKPGSLVIDLMSSNVNGTTFIELLALSKTRTRMTITADVLAKSIPAKLLFQSARLAKGRTQARLDAMVQGFAEDVEARFKS